MKWRAEMPHPFQSQVYREASIIECSCAAGCKKWKQAVLVTERLTSKVFFVTVLSIKGTIYAEYEEYEKVTA